MDKILFTTPIIGHPAACGPQLRIENSIKALSGISQLHIISRASADLVGGIGAQRFYEKYCANFEYVPSAGRHSPNRYIRKLQKIWIKCTNRDCEFILKYVKQNRINIIWFGYGNISFDLIYKIKKKMPDIKVVCDTDSVWSRFVLRELPYEDDPKRRKQIERAGLKKQKEEVQWVNLCEITTAVSEIDAQYYRSIAKEPGRIQIFSNVIDVGIYEKSSPSPKDMRNPAIYLAGFYGTKSPMDKAARWLIQYVLPIVRNKIPDVHLFCVGKGSDSTLADIKDPNITITGELDSVLPYLCNIDVALVPLKFESGTRFKILEAGACAIPVVSTTLGAEGIPVTNGKDILIADSPEDFAAAIVKLIQNKTLANEIAVKLRDLVISKYSIDSLEIEARYIVELLK